MISKKKHKLKNVHIFLIVLVIVVVVALVSYTLKNDKKVNGVESVFKDFIVEVQHVLYSPFKGISNFISDFSKLHEVLEENKILKSNIEKIESLEAENIELKQELRKMKEELNVDRVLSDYDYMNATVISRNSMYWYNNLTIDKGSKHGIEEGMVVINSTGLIGKITNVSNRAADVKLITTPDTNNKISVIITNGDDNLVGVINKYDYDEGYLQVEGISNTETVSVGDVVYTSGLGGVFPSGILIGYVDSITTDVYDLAKIINVKPSAKFDNINYVTVLKRDDNK